MRLQNQTILVTGGASGLGAATAEMIVAAGGRVIVADINDAAGRTAVARLGASGRFVKTDVTSDEDVQNAIATIKEFGGLHGVSAAIGPAARWSAGMARCRWISSRASSGQSHRHIQRHQAGCGLDAEQSAGRRGRAA
jgi:NAD(P)-dependent dehydrogenase (short-subunit alcohol dehydrogenase family)